MICNNENTHTNPQSVINSLDFSKINALLAQFKDFVISSNIGLSPRLIDSSPPNKNNFDDTSVYNADLNYEHSSNPINPSFNSKIQPNPSNKYVAKIQYDSVLAQGDQKNCDHSPSIDSSSSSSIIPSSEMAISQMFKKIPSSSNASNHTKNLSNSNFSATINNSNFKVYNNEVQVRQSSASKNSLAFNKQSPDVSPVATDYFKVNEPSFHVNKDSELPKNTSQSNTVSTIESSHFSESPIHNNTSFHHKPKRIISSFDSYSITPNSSSPPPSKPDLVTHSNSKPENYVLEKFDTVSRNHSIDNIKIKKDEYTFNKSFSNNLKNQLLISTHSSISPKFSLSTLPLQNRNIRNNYKPNNEDSPNENKEEKLKTPLKSTESIKEFLAKQVVPNNDSISNIIIDKPSEPFSIKSFSQQSKTVEVIIESKSQSFEHNSLKISSSGYFSDNINSTNKRVSYSNFRTARLLPKSKKLKKSDSLSSFSSFSSIHDFSSLSSFTSSESDLDSKQTNETSSSKKNESLILFATGLSSQEIKILTKFIKKFKNIMNITLLDDYSAYLPHPNLISHTSALSQKAKPVPSLVTHVISGTDDNNFAARTIKYMLGILMGAQIVSIDWVKDSLASDFLVEESEYYIKHDRSTSHFKAHCGPYSGRLSKAGLIEKLFKNYIFIFVLNPYHIRKFTTDSSLSKWNDLLMLIELGKGIVAPFDFIAVVSKRYFPLQKISRLFENFINKSVDFSDNNFNAQGQNNIKYLDLFIEELEKHIKKPYIDLNSHNIIFIVEDDVYNEHKTNGNYSTADATKKPALSDRKAKKLDSKPSRAINSLRTSQEKNFFFLLANYLGFEIKPIKWIYDSISIYEPIK
ncbi:Breast cancer type 1 susceptibility protein-like protein [Smittium culicis]|uniref:Breast cancer type 1 susceptibility protein-like protein n=1 Tax=Smittium culicis TaxID=133412 RepID=A0A1R1XM28_9FUNG|nr:Breast cancer type 1 susceptibility protein-like protein [Smittium culicis]